MYTVISEKSHSKKFAPLGQAWAHTNAESAVKHACARQRFEGEIYLVLYDGKVIFKAA